MGTIRVRRLHLLLMRISLLPPGYGVALTGLSRSLTLTQGFRPGFERGPQSSPERASQIGR